MDRPRFYSIISPLTTPTVLRTCLLEAAEAEMLRLDNKVRFIRYVVKGELLIANRKRGDIERDLSSRGFDRLPPKTASLKKK